MELTITPQMSTAALEKYSTPRHPNPFQQHPRCITSRTFLHTHFQFNKKPKDTTKTQTMPKNHVRVSQTVREIRHQAVSLVKLAEWLRITTYLHGCGRNVFDLALLTLKKASYKITATYALAAASFSLAAKLQSAEHFRGFKKLPYGGKSRMTRVSISQVIKYEQRILKALNFCVPVQNSRLLTVLQISRQWSLYLRKNSKVLKLPLRLLQIGTKQGYQTNNLKSVSYLLDLLTLNTTNLQREEELYVLAAMVVVGALNCCQIEQITNEKYVLVRFAVGFMKKCYPKLLHSPQMFLGILSQIYQTQLWKKVSLIPPQPIVTEQASSEEESWKWLDELQLIPFSEQLDCQ